MKRSKTIFTALTVIGSAAALVLLAGCAPGTGTDNGSPQPTASQTVDPATFKGKTIEYLYYTDGPDEKATRSIIASFEKKYGATVNLQILPYANLVSSLQARLAGGNAPDVVRLSGITPFVNDLLDLKPYLGPNFAKQFTQGTQPAFVRDGKVLGAPSDATVNGLLINTDLFNKAGVALPDKNKPWTWDQMLADAKEVQKKTGTQNAFVMDKSSQRLGTILSTYGTYVTGATSSPFDPSKATQALQPLVDMMNNGQMPKDFWLSAGSKYAGGNNIFLAQQAPVYLSGNWQVAQFATAAKFGWEAAPIPCAVQCGGMQGIQTVSALKASKNPALAAFFVQYLTNKANQTTFATTSNLLPTRLDLSNLTYSVRSTDMNEFIQDAKRTPAAATIAENSPYFSTAGAALIKHLDQAVAGTTSLSAAMQAVKADIDAIYKGN